MRTARGLGRLLAAGALVSIALFALTGGSEGSPAVVPAAVPQASAAADPLQGLTLRQIAGQRMIVGFYGTTLPRWLIDRVRRGEVGGVILYTRNISSRAALAAQMRQLQRISRPLRAPLLTMIDQEGGMVKRLPGAPSGSARAMGRRGVKAVLRAGLLTARNLRAAGVNVDLGPVMDIGRPGSYMLGTGRSFASGAAQVGLLGSAFARGLQQGGVAAALKHFPGMGGVSQDADRLVQTVGYSRRTLRAADEAPFRAGIAAGARIVLTSTARYPSLDRSAPAMLSRAIVTGELRGRLGFQGVAMTDDLNVTALAGFAGAGRLGILATKAGNDLLLFAHDPARAAEALDAIVHAVQVGALSRSALRAQGGRVIALRETLVR